MANFKNKASASACWLPIKKRLLAGGGAGSKKPDMNGNAKAADGSADADTMEPENGAAADDEASSPTTARPKSKGGRKPKSLTANSEEGNAAAGKKRVRAPKDPNAPPAKRGKKGNKKDVPDAATDEDVKVKREEVNGDNHAYVKTELEEGEGMDGNELDNAI